MKISIIFYFLRWCVTYERNILRNWVDFDETVTEAPHVIRLTLSCVCLKLKLRAWESNCLCCDLWGLENPIFWGIKRKQKGQKHKGVFKKVPKLKKQTRSVERDSSVPWKRAGFLGCFLLPNQFMRSPCYWYYHWCCKHCLFGYCFLFRLEMSSNVNAAVILCSFPRATRVQHHHKAKNFPIISGSPTEFHYRAMVFTLSFIYM